MARAQAASAASEVRWRWRCNRRAASYTIAAPLWVFLLVAITADSTGQRPWQRRVGGGAGVESRILTDRRTSLSCSRVALRRGAAPGRRLRSQRLQAARCCRHLAGWGAAASARRHQRRA